MDTEAYILNTKALGKADVLITILSPQGIYSIYGRGYMKPNHRFHVLINRGIKVKLYGGVKGNYYRVVDYDLLSMDNILTTDYELFERYTSIVKLVLYIRNLLDEVSFALFDFCIQGIDEYDTNMLIDLWKIYVLKKENVNLIFDRCVCCEKQGDYVTLSIIDGGLICKNCYSGQAIVPLDDIKTIYAFYESKVRVLKKGYNEAVSTILSELVEQNVGITIR